MTKQKNTNSQNRRNYRHGRVGTREYLSWQKMKSRCLNTGDKAFPNYGGRGITICEQWLGALGFETFWKNLGPRPSIKHSLDRIDNNGDYSPENCRWATAQEQANNRRSNVLLNFAGKTMNMSQWAKVLGIDKDIIQSRLKRRGWSVERALTQVPRRPGLYARKQN